MKNPFKPLLETLFKKRAASKEALKEMIEELEEKVDSNPSTLTDPKLNSTEKALLENVLKLKDVAADDVMIPRADITAAPATASFKNLIKLFSQTGFSRLPIYRDSLDDVVGYIHIRDLLSCIDHMDTFETQKILQKVLFIAPSMRLLDLLLHMRSTSTPIAVVVDEFGGVDGLVTGWNVIQEIMGGLEEPCHAEPAHLLTRLADGSYVVTARLEIADFEKKFGPILTAEEKGENVETLGGLIASLAGRVPEIKDTIAHSSGYRFEILEADPRRIKRVRILPPNTPKKTVLNGSAQIQGKSLSIEIRNKTTKEDL